MWKAYYYFFPSLFVTISFFLNRPWWTVLIWFIIHSSTLRPTLWSLRGFPDAGRTRLLASTARGLSFRFVILDLSQVEWDTRRRLCGNRNTCKELCFMVIVVILWLAWRAIPSDSPLPFTQKVMSYDLSLSASSRGSFTSLQTLSPSSASELIRRATSWFCGIMCAATNPSADFYPFNIESTL